MTGRRWASTRDLALSGAPGTDALLILALDGSSIEAIPWVAPGPSYVAIGAPRG